jgi:hypothetical protein
MKIISDKMDVLRNINGVVRVPFLIKGELMTPPVIDRTHIEAAFKDAGQDTRYLKLPSAQLIREPVIDRKTMTYTGEYLYQVLPPVDARALIETDIDKLVQGLYALPVEAILDYLSAIQAGLSRDQELLTEVCELCRLTAEYPDALLYASFNDFGSTWDRAAARSMIDNELSLWGKAGSDFLDGWVEVPASVLPGLTAEGARSIFLDNLPVARQPEKTLIRAMPTRQLHITAGNAPDIPVISAVRAILTKSAAVIKLPFGAALTGSLLAVAAATTAPNHPITRHLSVLYWQGGDESVEGVLFQPNAFDRVVVWGSPATVARVQARTAFTRTVCLNPRFGVSLIGRQAFDNNLEEVAVKAASDSLIYNQQACTASLVHYLEGTEKQVECYAEMLCRVLGRWDSAMPQFVPPSVAGQFKRLRRGKYASATWHINSRDGEYTSGVVVIPDEFDMLDHPMHRLVVIRPLRSLADSLVYLHQGVSTVGVYPEEQRTALRDTILARGVSNVLPLGECERLYAGMPHDGMPVLGHLVDWKNA